MTSSPRISESRFERSVDELARVFDFVREFFAAQKVDERYRPDVQLAVEEIFVNMVRYNAGNENEIVIRMRLADDRLAVSLVDIDVEPFDVRAREPTPVDRPLAERTPGGLGIQLTKRLMDDVEYEYRDRCGTTTLIKEVGKRRC